MEDFNKLLGLYIHIPFCDHICAYCDFKKMIANDTLKEEYIDALIKEIDYNKDKLSNIKSIFIGGGTPSCLSFTLLEKLLNKISESIKLDEIREFTIEANPNDLVGDNLNKWLNLFKKYHINRLSLGVQSFNNKKLKVLNRNHTKKDAILLLKGLYKNGFENVNCDFIFGLYSDNFKDVKKDLKIAIKNHVKHISCYSLILENHTMFYNMQKSGKTIELDEDKEACIYNKIVKYLKKQGIERYEISNFSYPGFESYHNMLTWNNNHYIGFGVAASSYVDTVRYTNIKNVKDYIMLIREGKLENLKEEEIKLSKDDMIYEHLILGLRKNKGINLKDFKERFDISIIDYYKNIESLINQNILELNDDYLRIKDDKLYLENMIINKIVS